MKIKISLLVLSALAIALFSGCGSSGSGPAKLIVTVNFGNPPKGGGPCGGKGVCSGIAEPPAGVVATPAQPATPAPATTTPATPDTATPATPDTATPGTTPTPPVTPSPASGIKTTFQLSPDDKNVLVMTFSMAELKAKQPEQVANFTDGGSYDFEGPFSLGDSSFASLKLAQGAMIDQNSKSKVSIKGDVVTVSYTYTHQ